MSVSTFGAFSPTSGILSLAGGDDLDVRAAAMRRSSTSGDHEQRGTAGLLEVDIGA